MTQPNGITPFQRIPCLSTRHLACKVSMIHLVGFLPFPPSLCNKAPLKISFFCKPEGERADIPQTHPQARSCTPRTASSATPRDFACSTARAQSSSAFHFPRLSPQPDEDASPVSLSPAQSNFELNNLKTPVACYPSE